MRGKIVKQLERMGCVLDQAARLRFIIIA